MDVKISSDVKRNLFLNVCVLDAKRCRAGFQRTFTEPNFTEMSSLVKRCQADNSTGRVFVFVPKAKGADNSTGRFFVFVPKAKGADNSTLATPSILT